MGYYITRNENLSNFKDEVLNLIKNVYDLDLDVSVWEQKEEDIEDPTIEIDFDIEDDILQYINNHDYVKEDSYEFWDFVEDNVDSWDFQKILKNNNMEVVNSDDVGYIILNTEVCAFKNCEIINVNNSADIDRFIDVMKENNFMR